MRTNLILIAALAFAPLGAVATLAGCEKKPAAPAAGGAPADDHAHAPGAGDDHGHGGAVIDLGEATIGAFSVKATRDAGQIVAGKDAPIDATVTPAAGATAKVAAVRFWIGTEGARGSVKARAEIENPSEPSRWHTHAEIPAVLPEGSRLWVEIEDDQGGKSVGSFDLKV